MKRHFLEITELLWELGEGADVENWRQSSSVGGQNFSTGKARGSGQEKGPPGCTGGSGSDSRRERTEEEQMEE